MRDTKSTWRRRVASWRASGSTADAFAEAHGLKAPTLRWWASQLKREDRSREVPLVRMARVIRAPAPAVARGSVIVDVPDARARVIVETGVERATLDAVFGALGIGGAP
jgi:hypothetical protein